MESGMVAARHYSTYKGEPGFVALSANETGRMLVSPSKHYHVGARVWALAEGDGATGFEEVLLIVKAWIGGICHHYAIDVVTGAIVATGTERRERESWKRLRSELVARGIVAPTR